MTYRPSKPSIVCSNGGVVQGQSSNMVLYLVKSRIIIVDHLRIEHARNTLPTLKKDMIYIQYIIHKFVPVKNTIRIIIHY